MRSQRAHADAAPAKNSRKEQAMMIQRFIALTYNALKSANFQANTCAGSRRGTSARRQNLLNRAVLSRTHVEYRDFPWAEEP